MSIKIEIGANSTQVELAEVNSREAKETSLTAKTTADSASSTASGAAEIANDAKSSVNILEDEVERLARQIQNAQSDWDETDTSSLAFIKNKPTAQAVNDGVLTIKSNNTPVATFSANSGQNVEVDLPYKLSQLTNDTGYTNDYNELTNKPVIGDGEILFTAGANHEVFAYTSANATKNAEINFNTETFTFITAGGEVITKEFLVK